MTEKIKSFKEGQEFTIGDEKPMQESEVQARIRLNTSKLGWRLWRNNVGVAFTADGRPVRYGLANDSPKLNKLFKSSDLIGIRPVLITQDMVGTVIGQFVAIEVKGSAWKYTGTAREAAQKKFIDFIKKLGGLSFFANNEKII